jgi:hypothetical protein
MPLRSSSLTKMTFTATSGTTTHGAQEIDLKGLSLGANSVIITDPGIKSALSSGNTINHSLQLEYGGGLSVVKFDGTPYVPTPILNILSTLYKVGGTNPNFAISVGSSPPVEGLAKAFDGNIYTKYLNFNRAGSDVLIDATKNYLVTGLGLTTANDGPERDPTSFILYGSNTPFVITSMSDPSLWWKDGSNFASGGLPGQTLIASGSLNPPLERVTAYPNVTFSNNSTRYRYYRLVFDSIRNVPYTANCVQISEIRLAGYL